MQKKGYDVPAKGLNYNGIKDALACKKKIMEGLGYSETPGTGKGNGPATSRDSPFKKNCPFSGTWILMWGAHGDGSNGHASACLVLYCNPVTGELKAECEDSSSAPNTNLPKPLPASVSSTGLLSAPPSTWSGANINGWVQINYPG